MPAAPFDAHKVLLITFKQGGEDTYNTILRRDPTWIADMLALRPNLAFSAAQINNLNSAGGLCENTRLDDDFCFTPWYEPLMPIWNSGQMALVHRVGNQFTPVANLTQAEIVASWNPFTGAATGIISPFGLGGHDGQSYQLGTMVSRPFIDSSDRNWSMVSSGWGGRMAEVFDGFVGVSDLPMMQIFGNHIFGDYWKNSQTAQHVRLPNYRRRFSLNSTNSAIMTRMLTMIDTLNLAVPGDIREKIGRNAYQTTKAATAYYDPVVSTVQGATPTGEAGPFAVDAVFPTISGNSQIWQGSLLCAARAVEWRLKFTNDAVKTDQPLRIALAVGWGDWDTHGFQGLLTGRLPDMQTDWAKGVAGFQLAMEALGMWDDTVIVDTSEFARTAPQNGALGSDHAWSKTCVVMGGRVKGKGIDGSDGHYGDYPTAFGILGAGSHDVNGGQVGLGSIKPLYSWEQLFEPVLTWFGADSDDLDEILPRRGVFVPPDAPANPDIMRPDSDPWPLDLVGIQPVIAVSTRKLHASAPDDTLTVRRSSDNATANIPWDDRWLDTGAIAAHVSSNSGYATAWKNQGTLGGTFTQATGSSQPTVVNAGTLENINGHPAIGSRPGNLDLGGLAAHDIVASGTDVTVLVVVRKSALTNNGGEFGFGGTSDGIRGLMRHTGDSAYWDVGNISNGRQIVTGASDGGGSVPLIMQRTYRREGTEMSVRRNAGAQNNVSPGRSSSVSAGTITFRVLGDAANGNFTTGQIAEIIVFASGNVPGLAELEANQMSAFGIS